MNVLAEKGLLQFDAGSDYVYDYKTESLLWISDVSQDSKSTLELSAKVRVHKTTDCTFQLNLQEVRVSGESLPAASLGSLQSDLARNSASFRLNANGEIEATSVEFAAGDSVWVQNVKRGIISAFQVRSVDSLRNLLETDASDKSALLYETDVLGRCRTTYKLSKADYVEGKSFVLHKKKALHTCTLAQTVKSSAVQYTPYSIMAVSIALINSPHLCCRRIFFFNIFCCEFKGILPWTSLPRGVRVRRQGVQQCVDECVVQGALDVQDWRARRQGHTGQCLQHAHVC